MIQKKFKKYFFSKLTSLPFLALVLILFFVSFAQGEIMNPSSIPCLFEAEVLDFSHSSIGLPESEAIEVIKK